MEIDFANTKGLRNLGNTCYFNSFMQLFLACNDIILFINNYEIPRELKNNSNKLNSVKEENIKNLQNFIRLYFNSSKGPDNSDFITSIRNIQKYLGIKNFVQQDAMEFLGKFLEIYNNCFPPVVKRNLNLLSDGTELKQFYQIERKEIYQTTIEPGIFNKTINPAPKIKSVNESYLIIPFPVKYFVINRKISEELLNLQDLLNEYCKKEIFEEEERTLDDKHHFAYSTHVEINTSKYLFIDLNRAGLQYEKINGKFKLKGVHTENKNGIKVPRGVPISIKVGNRVTIPNILIIPNTLKRYRLIGFYEHGGDATGGHYYAYKKFGKQWYLFNDTRKTPIDRIRLENQKFYAKTLLYEESYDYKEEKENIISNIAIQIGTNVNNPIVKLIYFYNEELKKQPENLDLLIKLLYYKNILVCLSQKLPRFRINIDDSIIDPEIYLNEIKKILKINY
jgi:ubiquitin C-terminal hydrolase